MNLSLPIYVESIKTGSSAPVFVGRPLFLAAPVVQGERVDRMLTRLAQDIGKKLTELAREFRHEELTACTLQPKLTQHRLKLTLELRRHTARGTFLFVVFRHFGRRIAFTPSVPDLWFDLARNELLADRATEMLTGHFRTREREDKSFDPEKIGLTGSAYVTSVEITIYPPVLPPTPPDIRFLLLGESQPLDGATELRRVGRCIDWLYPDDLDRVQLREGELAELARLLHASDRGPVVIVGPRQVGKTALVHEFVYREVADRRSPFRDRGNIWLVSPGRLISGMSYVGQWEDRLLAILKEAKKRRHILYFDDLLGLFQAGQSSQSTLNVAHVLKPYLERREVRVVAEITPEALRVLRERDRNFADLFHILPLNETDERDTRRILIAVQGQLENQYRCRFHLNVLPTVMDLQRRYGREQAFPGKAATFLKRLGTKYRGAPIRTLNALDEWQAQSGLAMTFLDRQTKLERSKVIAEIGKNVIGQEAAVEAAADVIAIAKARLNDPDRPLASFLFLGPTGVGKTQCARAIAAYLFGDAERMLRFDLNEFGNPGAAARLVGTFSQPEGLLTGAIRRQPFAVVLFDEVEKADPEVFDLLLQVLGEGRLTDALGRTADFSNALIVLTSNLGVREAESRLGFRHDEESTAAIFVQAVERFFRPEFFNRLDRIIAFRRLSREQVRRIADKFIGDIFAREGLVQRKCILQVEPAAQEHIVDQGFDPVLGARALKRAIERHLTQPIAAQLAVLPPGGFTIVRVYPGPDQLAVKVQSLEQVEPVQQPAGLLDDPEKLIRQVRAVVRRVEEEAAPLRPAGAIGSGELTPAHLRYFTLRDQLERIRNQLRELDEQMEVERDRRRGLPRYRAPDSARVGVKAILRNLDYPPSSVLREAAAAMNINEYVRDLVQSAAAVGSTPQQQQLLELVQQSALLHTMADCAAKQSAERVLLRIEGIRPPRPNVEEALLYLISSAMHSLHLETSKPLESHRPEGVTGLFLLVQGLHALPIARLESGLDLIFSEGHPVEPVQIDMVPLLDGIEPFAAAEEMVKRRRQWLAALQQGRAVVEDDPFRFGPVRRLWGQKHGVVDLRTGCTFPESSEMAAILLRALPLPPELTRME